MAEGFPMLTGALLHPGSWQLPATTQLPGCVVKSEGLIPGTAVVWQGGWRPALGSSVGTDPGWYRSWCTMFYPSDPHTSPRRAPLSLTDICTWPLGHMHLQSLVCGGPDFT